MAVRVGELPDSTMVATKIGSIRRVVCGSPAYLRRTESPKRPKSFHDFMCVTFSQMASGLSWTFAPKGGGAAKPIRPLCRLWINTAESAIDAAIAGVGLTNVLSYQVARAVHEGALQIVLQDHEPPPVPVHLIHAGQSILPLKTRRFLEFAAPRLRKSLETETHKLTGPLSRPRSRG
jgi:DNA-binding transcriptional LysR family regulator